MSKLYFLGPEGTYSNYAAKKLVKLLLKTNKELADLELTPVSTIARIIKLTDSDPNSFAILPVENSIEGIVRQTIDNIYHNDVKIVAQIELQVEHCLLAKGKKEKIKHIASHPQALAQCQQYISDNFDVDIDLINATSTAASAHYIVEQDETYAAIAREDIAKELNLKVIANNISDVNPNKTRFVLISKQNISLGINNRTSIVFNTKNEPGALYEILSIIKECGLNLIYLESRPSKRAFGEYNFFADIDKSALEITDALNKISAKCNFYKLLGSYCALE